MRRLTAEKAAYGLLVLGVLVDQLSTWLGLTLLELVELNPHAADLIARGLWPLVDLAIIIAIVLATELVDSWAIKVTGRRVFILLPALLGALRLMTGLHNLALIAGLFLP